MMVKLTSWDNQSVYVNPAEVESVAPCGHCDVMVRLRTGASIRCAPNYREAQYDAVDRIAGLMDAS